MSAEDHKQALPPGFRLGAYRVARILGVGGFGVTYLCDHAGLGVRVAVKEYLPNEIAVRDGAEVHPKSAGDREGFEWGLSRFLDEARTLARFEHPNVVRVRDCFEANKTAYIVMDHEDGEPLDRLLQRLGTLTEAQLRRVVLPVADGLRQVHAAGFLHRDVKPANVFVRRSDESPVLLDFGSARQALGHRSMSVTAIASAGYSPPEQYESGGEHGPWTDIYALSALCYRAITGEAPMEATRRQSQLLRTRTDPLPRLAETSAKGYAPAFLEAVDWGLRLIETERPQSLDEWLPRLEGAATPQSRDSEFSQTIPPAWSPATRRWEKRKPSTAIQWIVASAAIWAAAMGTALLLMLIGIALETWIGAPLSDMNDAEFVARMGVAGFFGCIIGTAAGGIQAARKRNAGQRRRGFLRTGIRWAPLWPMVQFSPILPLIVVVVALYVGRRLASRRGHEGRHGREGAARPRQSGESESKQAKQAHSPPATHRTGERKGVGGKAVRLAAALGLLLVVGLGVVWLATEQDAGEAAISVREAAEQGDAEAQIDLGTQYAQGDGVAKDAGQAALRYRKAAQQGHALAQHNLGVLYERGEGVPKDAGQAAVWYRRAAEQGLAQAQNNLGVLYERGEGVPKDAGQAEIWVRKAAEQGHASAQYNLGVMYANGEGVTEDDVQAVSWYRKAAEQGYALAQNDLGVLYERGEGVPKDAGQAAVWYRRAAEQGLASAQYNLGVGYANGEGVPKDDIQAVSWYRKAAEQGHAKAQNNLGVLYYQGDGVAKDAGQAASWYRKAADQGYAQAQHNLGVLYHQGDGVTGDAGQAAAWYRKAAEQGHADAQAILGLLYARGDGVPKDAGQAAIWFRKAAEQGHVAAQSVLGALYYAGEGVPLNLVRSYAWLSLAAAGGPEDARDLLSTLREQMTPAQIAEAQRLSRDLADR